MKFLLAMMAALASCSFAMAQKIELVVVSASWCGPCQRLKAESLPTVRKSFDVVEVDGDKDKSYRVSVYPTLIVRRDGKEIDRFTGFRDAESIVAKLNGHVGERPGRSMIVSKTKTIQYRELLARVMDGETLTVAVGTDDKADVRVESIEDTSPGLWRCWLENGTPKMQPIHPPPQQVNYPLPATACQTSA